MNLWNQKYEFRAFLTFGEELLIVRGGSVSVFRDVEMELFQEEYLTSGDLEII